MKKKHNHIGVEKGGINSLSNGTGNGIEGYHEAGVAGISTAGRAIVAGTKVIHVREVTGP